MLIYDLYEDKNGYQRLDIQISRGDSGSIEVELSGDTEIEDGTPAIISVKRNIDEDGYLWQKTKEIENGKLSIDLLPEETNIKPGAYIWDFRIKFSEVSIVSPILPSKFRILGVVGNVE